MASVRKRCGKWQVQVRRLGLPNISRTFVSKRDAQVWARDTEAQLDRGELPWIERQSSRLALRDLLDRYRNEITPTKRSAPVECYKIGLILRHAIASIPINLISPSAIARFRDERLQLVSTETVRQ